MARLLAGDEAAFVGLVERHQRAMLGLAATFTRNRALAQEIVQETWMAVLTGLSRFEGRSSLRTWIFRILMNRARTRTAREARTVPFSALGDEDAPALDPARFDERGMWSVPPVPWEANTPEAILGRKEILAVLDQAVTALPPRQSAVLVLRDLEHLDSEEVCELLDLTEGNLRVLLHRARTAVRAALEPHLRRA